MALKLIDNFKNIQILKSVNALEILTAFLLKIQKYRYLKVFTRINIVASPTCSTGKNITRPVRQV